MSTGQSTPSHRKGKARDDALHALLSVLTCLARLASVERLVRASRLAAGRSSISLGQSFGRSEGKGERGVRKLQCKQYLPK